MVGNVEDEPYCEMDSWGVMQDFAGFRLLGREIAMNRARVSSPIISWDVVSRTATTVSGRFYRMVGDPNPRVTMNMIRMHIIKHHLRTDDAVMVKPEELEELFPPRTMVV